MKLNVKVPYLSILIFFLLVSICYPESEPNPPKDTYQVHSQIESLKVDFNSLKGELASYEKNLALIEQRINSLERDNQQILSMTSTVISNSYNSFEKTLNIYRIFLFSIPTILTIVFFLAAFFGYKNFKKILDEARELYKRRIEEFENKSGEILKEVKLEHERTQLDIKKTLYNLKDFHVATLSILEDTNQSLDKKMAQLKITGNKMKGIKDDMAGSFNRISYEQLVKIINYGDEELRIYAVARLGDIKAGYAVSALRNVIDLEGDTKVAASAIGALGKSKDPSLLPYLESLKDVIKSEYGLLALNWAIKKCTKSKK